MHKDKQVYGTRAIEEALHANTPIQKIYLQNERASTGVLAKIAHLAKKNDVAVAMVPKQKLDKLAKNGNHQGVVAIISPISFKTLEEVSENINLYEQPIFLLLDGITDVRNFGAIIRTAECTGVAAIIVTKGGSAPINADTIKTSAGAALQVPIAKVDHIKDAIYHLQAHGITILAATEKADKTVYEENLNQAIAIILGAEGKGIASSVLKLANQKAKLPLLGNIESLNVSVACGVFLYEAVRQRLQ